LTDNKHGKELTLATSAFTKLNIDSFPHIHTIGKAEPVGWKESGHRILKNIPQDYSDLFLGAKVAAETLGVHKTVSFPHSWGLLSALHICITLNLAFNRRISSNRF